MNTADKEQARPITAPLLARLVAAKRARENGAPIAPLNPEGYADLSQAMQRGIARRPDAMRAAVEPFTEEELIAADLEYDRNKAFKAHRAQERHALRLQINDKSGVYA